MGTRTEWANPSDMFLDEMEDPDVVRLAELSGGVPVREPGAEPHYQHTGTSQDPIIKIVYPDFDGAELNLLYGDPSLHTRGAHLRTPKAVFDLTGSAVLLNRMGGTFVPNHQTERRSLTLVAIDRERGIFSYSGPDAAFFGQGNVPGARILHAYTMLKDRKQML